ncbi:MAG: hypothetical protein HY589_01300 [Candidatus Omnitrophica bacterium]|nr:hypothetical protein [Candidatus Omnitrophota bacterium]
MSWRFVWGSRLEMIKINLLPREVKKQQGPKRPVEFKIPELGAGALRIGIYSVSALIALHLFAAVSIMLKVGALNKLKSRWRTEEPRKAQIEDLNREVGLIEKKVLPVKELLDKRILWSRQLNALSNAMTPGVWLTKLYIVTRARGAKDQGYDRVLNIEGVAASLYGDEASLIAGFVKAIQGDAEFFKIFSEAKLGPMERAALDKSYIMNFRVFCVFKEGRDTGG